MFGIDKRRWRQKPHLRSPGKKTQSFVQGGTMGEGGVLLSPWRGESDNGFCPVLMALRLRRLHRRSAVWGGTQWGERGNGEVTSWPEVSLLRG